MATSHSDYCIIKSVSGCLMAQRLVEAGHTVQPLKRHVDSVHQSTGAQNTAFLHGLQFLHIEMSELNPSAAMVGIPSSNELRPSGTGMEQSGNQHTKQSDSIFS